MEAVVIGLKVVGTAFAAKTMIDGIKEGNLLKAVVGGVGAYLGASSLMSGVAAKGSAAASKVGSDSFAASAASGAQAPAEGFLAAGMDTGQTLASTTPQATAQAAQSAVAGAPSFASAAMDTGVSTGMAASDTALSAGTATDRLTASATLADKTASEGSWIDKMLGRGGAKGTDSGGDGFLGKAMDFANENPAVVQMGMGSLAGYAQGQAQQNIIEEKQRREDEARRRQGTTFATEGLAWNTPQPITTRRHPMGAR